MITGIIDYILSKFGGKIEVDAEVDTENVISEYVITEEDDDQVGLYIDVSDDDVDSKSSTPRLCDFLLNKAKVEEETVEEETVEEETVEEETVEEETVKNEPVNEDTTDDEIE